jgi:hypothetical protein
MRWIIVVALAACGDPTASPVMPDAAPPGTIGAMGGTVDFAGATLVVPPGALDHDVVITVSELFDGSEPTVTAVYTFEPAGLVFAVPATVTFTLEKPPFDLAVYWAAGTTSYQRLPSTTAATTISAPVTELGLGYPGPANPGLASPTMPLVANGGTLDLSCLGAARNDATSTQHILTTHVTDFQSGNLDANALITVFPTSDVSAASLSTATTDSSGNAPVSIPAGHKRVAFQITAANSVPTYGFDLLASATSRTSYAMSNSTMAVLPALIGVTPVQGAALAVDKVTDCQGHPLENLIGTVSSTKGTATSLPNAETYYFDAAVGLPTRHANQNGDGYRRPIHGDQPAERAECVPAGVGLSRRE